MLIANEKILKRILMLSLAGTRGGPVRLQILSLISKKPHNTNQLATKLHLDYKTVEYHIRVLEKSGFVTSMLKKYDNAFTLSPLLKANKKILKEIEYGKSFKKA